MSFIYNNNILLSQMFCMGDNEHQPINQDSKAKKIQNYIFKYEDLLGKGNFGAAYCGYDVNTGNQVAIKVIKISSIKSKISQKLLQNEIQILRNMKNHPNVLKCCDVFTSINNCYIVTERCDRDLQKDLVKKGKFRQHEIKEIAYGVYKGLQQLSKNSIIHRDIKISNIFIAKNGTPKIADFGFAIKANTNFNDLNIGSPLYMSPEGLLNNQYGPKTDVWSFGVLLYELVHGQTPLERCTKDSQLKQQILQTPRFLNSISHDLKQAILTCLTVDEKKRPNIFQLGSLPYFKKLIGEIEGHPISFKQSLGRSTDCSQQVSNPKMNIYFFNKQISYANAVSLLHYCRLLHKINRKQINSAIFSQFLLNISYELTKIKISSQNSFNEQINKMKQVLYQYHNKFKIQYEDSRLKINPRDMLLQIDRAIKSKTFNMAKAFEVLDSQTKILIYSIQHQNPDIFSKNTQAQASIQNVQLNL